LCAILEKIETKKKPEKELATEVTEDTERRFKFNCSFSAFSVGSVANLLLQSKSLAAGFLAQGHVAELLVAGLAVGGDLGEGGGTALGVEWFGAQRCF
jgi:hypothetical protein